MKEGGLVGKKIVFFANVDWSFLSHRREMAQECVTAGADVYLMAGDTGRLHEVAALGVTPIPIPMSRTGKSLYGELRTLVAVVRCLRQVRPDLLHNVSIKPMLYGSMAALVARPDVVVNAVSGAGSVFDGAGSKGSVRAFVSLVLGRIVNRPSVHWVFQNESDLELYQSLNLVAEDQFVLTMGSGVDLERFSPTPLPESPVVLFASRLIWSKGIGVFVEAARLVQKQKPEVRFVVAGDPEDENSERIGRAQLDEWIAEGIVEWAGIVDDMPTAIARATMVVLPSAYREGVPKILLEAASGGRPVVAGVIPGGRRSVIDGVTGLLVDPKDEVAVADAILELLAEDGNLNQMSMRARRHAEEFFSVEAVVETTIDLYQRAMTCEAEPASVPGASAVA